jgi:hypothetical protein
MVPVEAKKLWVGYRLEMPAMSSAASGAALVVARVISVDIALEVCGCCNPSAWPSSCTSTVKYTSCQLASGGRDESILVEVMLRGNCTRLRRIGIDVAPFAIELKSSEMIGLVCAMMPGRQIVVEHDVDTRRILWSGQRSDPAELQPQC